MNNGVTIPAQDGHAIFAFASASEAASEIRAAGGWTGFFALSRIARMEEYRTGFMSSMEQGLLSIRQE